MVESKVDLKVDLLAILSVDQLAGLMAAELAVNSVEHLAASKELPSEKNLVEYWVDYLDMK